MSVKPLKILACGDVKGQIGSLLNKIENVNKKSGPFEMVLCLGKFFDDSPEGVDNVDLWKQILSDKVTSPVQIYILGPVNQSQLSLYPNLDGCEFGGSICYLGRSGVYLTKEGLSIAYFSGVEGKDNSHEEFALNYERLRSLEVKAKCHDSSFQGVDILFTTEWPKGILNYCPPIEGLSIDEGSPMIARLAVNLRPRYHFAGFKQTHFERLPYRNHQVLSEHVRHVTRFISLHDVNNLAKKKWLYAFNIIPMSSIEKSELLAQPANVTEMPFKESHLQLTNKSDLGKNQFFYDMNASMEDNQRKRGRHNGGEGPDNKRPPPKPTGPCWFCLSGQEVEKHLVVSIGEHAYLALPKGGLTNYHVMILPIAHHPSTLELPKEVSDEIEKFKSALKKCFKKSINHDVVFFERNYRSQHLQLQVVPIPTEVSNEVKLTFEDMGESMSLEMTNMPDHSSLAQMAQPGTPYFYVEFPNNTKLFHRVRRGFPIQFGREVLASTEILNLPDRIDWRECQESKEKETEMTKEFRKLFEPYDFTLE